MGCKCTGSCSESASNTPTSPHLHACSWMLPHSTLVPLTIQSWKTMAIVDTGSSYTPINEQLWNNIKQPTRPNQVALFLAAKQEISTYLPSTMKTVWHCGRPSRESPNARPFNSIPFYLYGGNSHKNLSHDT